MGDELVTPEINLGSLLKDMDVNKVDSFLSTLTKYEKIFDKVSGMLTKLDKMGVIPAIIRTAGHKAQIPDLDKPLTNPLTIQATTGAHMMFYTEINKLPENIVTEMYKQLLLAEAKAVKEIPPVKELKVKE